MVIEELIGRLALKFTGGNDARKFISDLAKARAELEKFKGSAKGFKVDFKSSGVDRLRRDLGRATADAVRLRKELAAAGRVSMRGPGGRLSPNVTPGRPARERMGHGRNATAGEVAGGVVAGGLISETLGEITHAIVKPFKVFASEETARKQVELTANVPAEKVAADFENMRAQARDLATSPKEMLEVMNHFLAAGLEYDTAVKSVAPTIKAAKAGSAPVADVAKAGIAAIDNLKVSADSLTKAYEIMLASGKAGQIEMKDLPGILPEALASAQKAGYKDLEGLREISAFLQYARKSTSSASEAGNNAANFYEKLFAPVTQKKFKEAGIDLEAKIKAGEKKGENAAQVAIREMIKFAKGDQFKAKNLFEDKEAGSFATAAMQYRKEITSLIDEIRNTQDGMVDKDFANVMGTLTEKFNQLTAATSQLLGVMGEYAQDFAKGTVDIASEGIAGFAGNKQSAEEERRRRNLRNSKLGGPIEVDEPLLPIPPSFTKDPTVVRLMGRAKRRSLSLATPTSPGFHAPTLGNSFGLSGNPTDWMRSGAERATSNITNNNQDQRTQSVTVNQTVNGVPGVAQAAASGVSNALSGMGPSIVKANPTPTVSTP